MRVLAVLEAAASAHQLLRIPCSRGIVYGYSGPLGEHDGEAYTVALTITCPGDGTYHASAQAWLGEHLVAHPPLQANWPTVKALRELHAGDTSEDVIGRLLTGILGDVRTRGFLT